MHKALYEGRFLRMVDGNGWEYVERVNANGVVVIVAVTNENKLLLVEQYRIPVQKSVIELPAGLAGDEPSRTACVDCFDAGSSCPHCLINAAKRELFEETGYKADTMNFLIESPSSCGLSSEIVTTFHASGLNKVAEGGGDETENITVHEVPLDHVNRWLLQKEDEGFLVDSKIYAALWLVSPTNMRVVG